MESLFSIFGCIYIVDLLGHYLFTLEECNPHLHKQPHAQIQLNIFLFKNPFPRARELAQSLKALAALAEHLGCFQPLHGLQLSVVQIQMPTRHTWGTQANTHIHLKKPFSKKWIPPYSTPSKDLVTFSWKLTEFAARLGYMRFCLKGLLGRRVGYH